MDLQIDGQMNNQTDTETGNIGRRLMKLNGLIFLQYRRYYCHWKALQSHLRAFEPERTAAAPYPSWWQIHVDSEDLRGYIDVVAIL